MGGFGDFRSEDIHHPLVDFADVVLRFNLLSEGPGEHWYLADEVIFANQDIIRSAGLIDDMVPTFSGELAGPGKRHCVCGEKAVEVQFGLSDSVDAGERQEYEGKAFHGLKIGNCLVVPTCVNDQGIIVNEIRSRLLFSYHLLAMSQSPIVELVQQLFEGEVCEIKQYKTIPYSRLHGKHRRSTNLIAPTRVMRKGNSLEYCWV